MNTWTIPAEVKKVPYTGNQRRLYSLFENKDGRWIRISEASYYLNNARLVFQDRLISAIMIEARRVELRPIQIEGKEAQ